MKDLKLLFTPVQLPLQLGLGSSPLPGAPWEILDKNSEVEAVVRSEGRNLPGGHLCKSATGSTFLPPPRRVSVAYLSRQNSENEGTESPGGRFLYNFILYFLFLAALGLHCCSWAFLYLQ